MQKWSEYVPITIEDVALDTIFKVKQIHQNTEAVFWFDQI